MNRTRHTNPGLRLLFSVRAICGAMLFLIIFAATALARVGGGQSYGGGGGHGGGGGGGGAGGAIIWLVFQVIRILFYLTIEYPVIGIPLDMLVIGSVVYYFARRRGSGPETFSSAAAAMSRDLDVSKLQGRPDGFAREVEQLRKFDPNFSEIVFTDFCYALYAKAHDARGRGAAALDLFSPYLSELARAR
jgi:hypothetical protein